MCVGVVSGLKRGGHSARGSCSLEPMPAPAIKRVALLEGPQERPVQVRDIEMIQQGRGGEGSGG